MLLWIVEVRVELLLVLVWLILLAGLHPAILVLLIIVVFGYEKYYIVADYHQSSAPHSADWEHLLLVD